MLTAHVEFCPNNYALIVAGWFPAKGQLAQPTVHSEIKGTVWNIEKSCLFVFLICVTSCICDQARHGSKFLVHRGGKSIRILDFKVQCVIFG